MNAQLMDQARAAYRAGDFSSAAQLFASAKTADEICGEADHLRGNSLMRLGLFQDAADAYSAALRDASYGKSGALLTNQGKALAAAGDFAGAANSFGLAVQDSSYATPYKAYMGLGNALLKSGNPTDAGVAFRSAAIDGANRKDMLLHITIPRILPSVMIMLILQLASLFISNFDQVYNLYNNYVLSTGDVLSTYIYRISLGGGTSFELSTAINLVLQVLGLIVVLITNKFVSKLDIMGIF